MQFAKQKAIISFYNMEMNKGCRANKRWLFFLIEEPEGSRSKKAEGQCSSKEVVKTTLLFE